MSENSPTPSSKQANIKERFYHQTLERSLRALNYLSIYAFIILVYGGALVTDYLIFSLVAWLLKEDVQRYPVVAAWFDYARIGLALLLIAVALIHGILSTFGQIRLDLTLSREGEEK